MKKSDKNKEFDERRKKETVDKLKNGIRDLSRLKEHQTKEISKLELSKHTGVSRSTIDRYPEIVQLLHEVNMKISDATAERNVDVNLDSVASLDEAKILIETMSQSYNELALKHDKLKQMLTQKDLEIVKLNSEVTELKLYLKNRK